jgi:hypothetical protein
MTLPTALIALSILIAWEIATAMNETATNPAAVAFAVVAIIYALAVWLAPAARMVIDRQERNKDND